MHDMKDSGIEWIGEIPAHWEKLKIKNAVVLIGSGTTPSSGNSLYYMNGNVFWIQSGDIYGKSVIENTTTMVTEFAIHSIPALRMYTPPYIVVAMYGGSVGNIAVSEIQACVNQACCCIMPDSKNDLKFMYYWLITCRSDFLRISDGGGQPNISQSKIRNQIYLQPPIDEQKRIAAYLDKKCDEIRLLCNDIQSQISSLEEYKRSVITEAVTKGLNADVEMKDSGIEWCPAIPKHWYVVNPKSMFSLRTERARKGERQLTASQKLGIVYQDEFMQSEGQKVVTVEKDFNILKHVEPNDFVISMRSFQGGLEYSELSGSISSAYVMLIPNKDRVYPAFWRWFFKSSKYINAIQSTTNLVRDGQAMRYANFVKVPLFTIPLEEQKEIADYLNIKCKEIDEILTLKKDQLATLEQYKKSLLYEYVTGKKEVPNE